MTGPQQTHTPAGAGLARFAGRSTSPSPQTVTEEMPAPLQRFLAPRAPKVKGQACEMCGQEVPEDDHRHVVDLDGRSMLCVCRGCALLFLERGAAQGRYLAVPERYLRIQPFVLDRVTWASLQIPVGVVFVVQVASDETADTPVAFYPSPGGATESELPMQAWSTITADTPVLADVEPDVEAVLIRTHDTDDPACYIVPVDRCYELVGALRLQWRGFDGGQDARQALGDFFADIDRRSKVTSGMAAGMERAGVVRGSSS